MNRYRYVFLTIIFLIVYSISGCSDDPASVNPGDEPEIPESAPAEVQLEFFENNNPPNDAEHSAFHEANNYAQTANSSLSSVTFMGENYMELSAMADADFEDGKWVWTFSYEEGGESFTMKMTAEEVSGGVNWRVYISGYLFDDEQFVEEFLFITGFISNDRSSGNWNYHFPDDQGNEQTWLTYEWNTTSDSVMSMNFTIYNEEGGTAHSVEYVQNGPEHTITYTSFGVYDNLIVYWNTDTGEGYVDKDGDRECWDSGFQNVACS